MAYATVTIPGDGSTTLITASFALGEINQEHVTVRVTGEVNGSGDPVYRTYTKLGSSQYQVDGAAAPVDQFYIVERRVPKEELLVDWEDNDAITEANLNTAQKQAIMIAHEALDQATFAVKTIDNTVGPSITRGAANTIPMWNADGNLVVGPSAADIAGAAGNAAAALASAIRAEAAADEAEAIVDDVTGIIAGAVRLDIDQATTSTQKVRAQRNIGLLPQVDTLSIISSLDLTAIDAVVVKRYSVSSEYVPAVYNKVGANPNHLLSVQDTVGNWFEIDKHTILSPHHAGADGAGDETAIVQAVLNLAQARGSKFDGGGHVWPVTKISIGTGNEYFEIAGNTQFLGIDSNAQTAVLEITRGNFNVSGSLGVSAGYRANYEAGIWVHNDAQIQFVDLQEANVHGALVGLRIGDIAHGSSVTSEITVNAPKTYGCPIALMTEGGNSFYSIVAPPAISADAFGGDAAWAARPRHAIVNKGATVVVLGGEIIQVGSGLATDHLIEMQPCMFNTDIAWGRVVLIGSVCETAGPLAKITNPLGLSGTALSGDRAALVLQNVTGYHSQNNAPMITVDATTYPGDIRLHSCNMWFPGTRTQQNINSLSALCNIYSDEHGLGAGFKNGLGGITGGIVHFGKRTLLTFIGLPATATAAGSNNLNWTTVIPDADSPRFSGQYSGGVFTVPAGGLKELSISASAYISGVVGRIAIRENGTEFRGAPFMNGVGSINTTIQNAAAGATYSVVLVVDSGAGAAPSASGFLHTLQFEARN